MTQDERTKELMEIIGQVQSLLERMKYLAREKPSCPMCGETVDGIGVCEVCKADPRD